jgi:hypothetical protein
MGLTQKRSNCFISLAAHRASLFGCSGMSNASKARKVFSNHKSFYRRQRRKQRSVLVREKTPSLTSFPSVESEIRRLVGVYSCEFVVNTKVRDREGAIANPERFRGAPQIFFSTRHYFCELNCACA